jgi:hypothetical protein
MSSRSTVVVGIVIVVVVILFFLLPIVPYSSSDTSLSALGAKATAGVSPSYLVFNCGIVYNPSIGATYGSASVASHPWQGGRWECGTGWQ